jgi:predicted nucleotidyltransferase
VDKSELTEVLAKLDKELSRPCELVVIGGAAMILHYGSQRATRDVDALFLRGDILELRRAIKEVARERNLPDDWLSEAAKGFADILPRDFQRRLVPLEMPLSRLRVYVLGLPEQVAMKIVALREQDLEDLEILIGKMSEADKQQVAVVMHDLAIMRPDWAQKIQYFMQERGWKTL